MSKVVVEEIPEALKDSSEIKEISEKTEAVSVPNPISTPTPASISEVIEDDKPNYLWIIIPTALIVGIFVGGFITYFSGISKINNEIVATPIASVMPSIEPIPTIAPISLKRGDVKVQVLNGSGVSGLASKVKTLLEGLGYVGVDTGNATVSNLAQTEVAIKATTKKEFLDLIIKDLAKSYEATEAAKPLSATSKYDIVVTLGKK